MKLGKLGNEPNLFSDRRLRPIDAQNELLNHVAKKERPALASCVLGSKSNVNLVLSPRCLRLKVCGFSFGIFAPQKTCQSTYQPLQVTNQRHFLLGEK